MQVCFSAMFTPLCRRFTMINGIYRSLLLMLLAGMAALCISAYLYSQQHHASMSQLIHEYGDSITQLSADQVVTSLLNGDAISLQAAAQNIINKSIASSVIIYNVNNVILAQANGEDMPTDTEHYTSPIVSGNNIIGSITIGISATLFTIKNDQTITFIILFFLLVAMIIVYIKAQQHATIPETDNKTITTMSTGSENSNTLHPQRIFLVLHIQNINTLYQQLNAELRAQQLDQLDNNIQHALRLYSGEAISTTDDCIILGFNHHDKEQISNALYSGSLIIKLNQQSPDSVITINGLIQSHHGNHPLSKRLHGARKSMASTEHQHTLFISQTLIDEYQLQSKIDIDNPEGSSTPLKICHLKGHYQLFLDKQIQKLMQET
jgi:hypothetical protein